MSLRQNIRTSEPHSGERCAALSGSDAAHAPQEFRAALEALDALAAQLIACVLPIRLGEARTPSEREAVYRLRYRVALERGWLAPQDFPSGLEQDEDDDAAIQVAAWDGDTIIATSRLVLPRPGHLLPTERTFGLNFLARDRMVHMGRICAVPLRNRGREHLFQAVLAQSWLEMRQRGFTEGCGTLTASMLRLWRKPGLKVEILGPAKSFWGELRYPVLVRPQDSVESLLGSTKTVLASIC